MSAAGCAPVVLDPAVPADRETLDALRADGDVVVLDHRAAQREELAAVVPTPPEALLAHPGVWVHYPWRRTLVGVLGAEAFRLLRLDRNRNKITAAEQARLTGLRIGVVGLSVGHAIAHTLALEGLCGALRLADFDTLELSNLNRIPASLLDLGENKAVVAARRIAELDPFLDVAVLPEGLTPDNLAGFLDGLDVLVEECDSLDVKVLLRQGARERGIPVLMQTSDRGLLDVERFDLEPGRPLFHGLLGDLDPAALAGLATKDKVPHVLRILDAPALSARMAASMAEVGRTLTTWPQLGGDVTLGGACVAAAVRRLGTGAPLASGRVRIDPDDALDTLGTEAPDTLDAGTTAGGTTAAGTPVAPLNDEPWDAPGVHPAAAAVVAAVRRAPSGGNVQPWRVAADATGVHLHLAPERTTTMDVAFRGSHVAIGAALHNARVAAAAAGALGPVSVFPDPAEPTLVATLSLNGTAAPQPGPDAAAAHEAVLARVTNRNPGSGRPLDDADRDALRCAAAAEGGRVHLVEPGAALAEAAEVLAAADRARYLTKRLHAEMVGELSWPGRDRLDVGIDVTTLGLDAADLAVLEVVARPEVVSLLAGWEAGQALGDDTRDRVAGCSALAVVTVDGAAPADYVRGGAAVEAVWVRAQARGLGVQPISPVFLYGTGSAELAELSAPFADELAALRARFAALAGLAAGESVALVLRLSHDAAAAPASGRRPAAEITLTR
ncbi:Rv1355c family protein [Rhodococcus aerolatus]